MIDARQERGYQIFQALKITPHPKGDGWIVPSQTSNRKYHVTEEFVCDCPDSEYRKATCKHAFAARYYLQIEKDTPLGTETEKVKLTHKQAWKAYNEAQTNEIRLFDELLKDLVDGVEEPPQQMGRPRLSLRDLLFCSVQKVYSQLSSRRARSLFGNAEERKQIARAPNYNAVNKFLNREDLTPILHGLVGQTARPLQSVETEFAIDSSGFRTTRFHDYGREKHHLRKQHRWLKAHICVGVKTNVITGIEITEENAGDSPQFKPLVEFTAGNGFHVEEVSADKAYSSRANYETVKAVGGQAYIPFKTNATGKSRGSRLWVKMYHLFQFHSEEFMEHYHKRSNAETTFHMIKAKFGDILKSKNPAAQKNELLCKAIAHNIVVLIHEMHELGIAPNFHNK
jgi:transposase